MAYHISEDGTPRPCKATKRPCRFGNANAHYESKEEAQAAFERTQDTFAKVALGSQVPMISNKGTAVLKAGVLTPEALITLTNGCCMDLAQKLHEKTGYPIVAFFTQGVNESQEAMEKNFEAGEEFGFHHAAVKTPDGHYIDAYGVRDKASIENSNLSHLDEWEVKENFVAYQSILTDDYQDSLESFVPAIMRLAENNGRMPEISLERQWAMREREVWSKWDEHHTAYLRRHG